MIQKKILPVALVLLNILFLIYYAFWSFNGFLHFDDLGATAAMAHSSIIRHVYDIYMGQSGRFVGCFICAVIFKFVAITGVYRFFPLLFLLIGYGLMGLCVKNLPFVNKKLASLIALLLYNLYVLTAIDFAVFIWICALYYYLLAPSLVLFCIYLSKKTLNVGQWILFVLSGIFIAGGSEAFTPVALVVMFLTGMYYWYSNKWSIIETWNQPQVKRIVFAAIGILILFAVVVVAPGNYVRMQTSVSEGFAHPDGLVGWGVAIAKCCATFLYLSAFYFPYYLVPFCLFIYLGTKQTCILPYSKPRMILILTIFFACYLIASVLPIAYVYNGFGIQRLYTHVTFMLILYICGLGYVIGMNTTKLATSTAWLSAIGIICLSGITIINIANDVPIMQRFSKSVDDRVTYLTELQKKGNTETVEVEPYANMRTIDAKYTILKWLGKKNNLKPYLYYEADTDVTPNEYEDHYRKVYGLDFDFVLKTEKL